MSGLIAVAVVGLAVFGAWYFILRDTNPLPDELLGAPTAEIEELQDMADALNDVAGSLGGDAEVNVAFYGTEQTPEYLVMTAEIAGLPYSEIEAQFANEVPGQLEAAGASQTESVEETIGADPATCVAYEGGGRSIGMCYWGHDGYFGMVMDLDGSGDAASALEAATAVSSELAG
ncbi:MAG: hypothetical protein WD004_05090 [Actinomycetota bacterium]